MKLSTDERRAVEGGEAVRFVIPESDVECVVVRSDLLDPLLSRADLDPCDPDEFLPLMAELLEDEDWSVPLANTENIAS